MKKNLKSKIKENLGDAVVEVVFSIILLGIGACVLALFGVGGDAKWLDGDLLILIGLGVIIIPVGVISAIVHAIKKKKKAKDKHLTYQKK